MNTTRAALLLALTLPLLPLAACQTSSGTMLGGGPRSQRGPSLNDAPVSTPEIIDVWEGRANFARHLSQSGNIYFAGQPDENVFPEARIHKITTVVNLRTEPEMTVERIGFDEPALAREFNLTYVSIPVGGGTLSTTDADKLADALARVPASNAALIHCGSSNRVGALWALYLNTHRDIPIDQAIDEGRAAGLRSEKLEQQVRSLAQ